MGKQHVSWLARVRGGGRFKTLISVSVMGALVFPTALSAAGDPRRASGSVPPAVAAPNLRHDFPEFAARIVESRPGLAPHIYVVLDTHCQPLVQENIHRVLAGLAAAGKIDLIALEGSTGPISTEPLATFADCAEKQEMLAAAQMRGKLGGAEFACLEHGPAPVRLLGVENQTLYFSCLRQIPLFVNDEALALLAGFEAELDHCCSQLHNPGLALFLKQRQNWLRGNCGDAAYARELQDILADCGEVGPEELGAAVIPSAGNIAACEKRIKQALLRTPAEEQVMYLAERVGFLRQAFSLSLDSSQVGVWLGNEAVFQASADFRLLQNLSLRLKINSRLSSRDCDRMEVYAGRAYKFYADMNARETALVANLATALRAQPAGGAALVIGGFHQAGVVRLLAERGWAYTVLKPSGSGNLPAEAYLNRLQQAVAGAYREAFPAPQSMLAVPSLLSRDSLRTAVFKLGAWRQAVFPRTPLPAAAPSGLRSRLVTVLGAFQDRFAVRAGAPGRELVAAAASENEAEVSERETPAETFELGNRVSTLLNPFTWGRNLGPAQGWMQWGVLGFALLALPIIGCGATTSTAVMTCALGPWLLGLGAGSVLLLAWQGVRFRQAAGQDLLTSRPVFKYFTREGIRFDDLSLEALEKNDPGKYRDLLRHALAVERADQSAFSLLERVPVVGAALRRLGLEIYTAWDFQLRLGILPWFRFLATPKAPTNQPYSGRFALDAGTREFAARVQSALPGAEAQAYQQSAERRLCRGLGIEPGHGAGKLAVRFTRALPERLLENGMADSPLLLRVLAVLATVATSDASSNQSKSAFEPLYRKLVRANGLAERQHDLLSRICSLGKLLDGLFARSPREVKLALELIGQLDDESFRNLLCALDPALAGAPIDQQSWSALRADLLRLASDIGEVYSRDKLILEVSDPLTVVLPGEDEGFRIRAFPTIYDFTQGEMEAVSAQTLEKLAGPNNLHAMMIFGGQQITPEVKTVLEQAGYHPVPGGTTERQFYLRGDHALLDYIQGKYQASLANPGLVVRLLESVSAGLIAYQPALAAGLLRTLLRNQPAAELYARFFMQRTHGAFGLYRCLVQSAFPGSRLAKLLAASPQELEALKLSDPLLGKLGTNLAILSQTRSYPSNYLILQSIRDAARWLQGQEETLSDADAARERRAFACLLLLPFNTGDPERAKTVAAWGWGGPRLPSDPAGLFQGKLRLGYHVATMFNENLKPWLGSYRLEPSLFKSVDRQDRFLRRAQQWLGSSS